MSEGIEEIKRGGDEDLFKRERLGDRSEYGHSVSKMAVAQICQGVGFEAVKQSSLEALSRLLVQFVSSLGKSATYNANLAGRTESNVFDVIKGLQDLLGGCSSPDSKNIDIVNEMSEFVQVMEIPFGYSIPRFPVSRRTKIQTPSFLQMGETPGNNHNHIPDWLPAFPDPHTYINSPLWNQRKSDLRINKGEQARQRRKAERSLLNLQQRLVSNAFAGPSSSAPATNQPLALPSTNGSKDVNQNGIHFKKYVLVKQMFAPAIEALAGGGGGGVDAMDIDTRVIPVSKRKRPVVHFKMKAGKKMLVQDLDIDLRSRFSEKRTSIVGRDGEKDDKKSRAQLILRHSSIPEY